MPTRIVLPIGMIVLLQGCANTPIAQDLEQRFSEPAPITATPAPDRSASAASAQPADVPVPSESIATGDQQTQQPKAQEEPGQAQQPSTTLPVVDPPALSLQPQPYRITIRLSAADPSAPAEMVTRALRRSNVPFAVERIESIAPSP